MPTRRGPQPSVRYDPVSGAAYRSPGVYARAARTRPVGDFTGAPRPTYPQFFRKYGRNTRDTVGYRDTGVWDNRYDADIVQSRPSPALVPTSAVSAFRGSAPVLQGVTALEPGSDHWLFATR